MMNPKCRQMFQTLRLLDKILKSKRDLKRLKSNPLLNQFLQMMMWHGNPNFAKTARCGSTVQLNGKIIKSARSTGITEDAEGSRRSIKRKQTLCLIEEWKMT